MPVAAQSLSRVQLMTTFESLAALACALAAAPGLCPTWLPMSALSGRTNTGGMRSSACSMSGVSFILPLLSRPVGFSTTSSSLCGTSLLMRSSVTVTLSMESADESTTCSPP